MTERIRPLIDELKAALKTKVLEYNERVFKKQRLEEELQLAREVINALEDERIAIEISIKVLEDKVRVVHD